MKEQLIGRKKEQEILQKALASNSPEMVAIIGRRRVGKTFLVRTAYAKQLVFEITGLQKATKSEQLQNFALRLNNYAKPIIPIKPVTNWLDAFQMLIDYLETKIRKEKIVVFLSLIHI